MIKIIENGKTAEATGAPAHLAMFYSFWQGHVWEGWQNHDRFDDASDSFSRQVKSVIESIHEGTGLTLCNEGEHGEALPIAIAKCKALGIRVES